MRLLSRSVPVPAPSVPFPFCRRQRQKSSFIYLFTCYPLFVSSFWRSTTPSPGGLCHFNFLKDRSFSRQTTISFLVLCSPTTLLPPRLRHPSQKLMINSPPGSRSHCPLPRTRKTSPSPFSFPLNCDLYHLPTRLSLHETFLLESRREPFFQRYQPLVFVRVPRSSRSRRPQHPLSSSPAVLCLTPSFYLQLPPTFGFFLRLSESFCSSLSPAHVVASRNLFGGSEKIPI